MDTLFNKVAKGLDWDDKIKVKDIEIFFMRKYLLFFIVFPNAGAKIGNNFLRDIKSKVSFTLS